MTNRTRSTAFPPLSNMPASSNNENHIPASFASSGWQARNDIWGNGVGSVNPQRDTASSRGSGELSPTAPSGSAQLNAHSEAAPFWRFSNPSNASPNVSPTHHGALTTGAYTRQSIGHTRTPVLAVAGMSLADMTDVGYVHEDKMLPNDERNRRLRELNPHPISEVPRRNSEDPSFVRFGTNRSGTYGQPETPVSTIGNQFRATPSYGGNPHTMRPQPRASVSNSSVTLSNGYQFELNSRTQGLSLEDPSEPTNGYNQVSEPFQFNPGSQAWIQGTNHSTRRFSHGLPQDTWVEASHPSFSAARNGSDRSSPASNPYSRALNNPRNISSTPVSRTNPWSQPAQHNPNLAQDLDRQQPGPQYLHQPTGIYSQPSYYQSNLSQFHSSYDQYGQTSAFQSSLSRPGFITPTFNGGVQSTPDKSPGHVKMSPLLAQFRNERTKPSGKRWELKEIRGYVVEFCGDQYGSRFIQEKLQTAKSEEKEWVFLEIEPNILPLMRDVFGNYVIQKFYEHGNQAQKKILAEKMKGKVVWLSQDTYACRVVQKALDHVLVEQQHEIVEELRSQILPVSLDNNGNHVIQKVVEVLPSVSIPFIMEAFRGQVDTLGKHNFACRVIQRILESGRPEERKSLMADLHACTAKLVVDTYGNYVIQHIIENGEAEERARMIQYVTDRALNLSKHKFASNVVEKCIVCGSAEQRRAIRDKFTTSVDGTSDANPLPQLIKDQFANYVIQKLVEYLKGDERASFIEELRPHIANSKKQGPLRQIAALERKITELTLSSSTNGGPATSGTAPSTPNLVVEVSSDVPTPCLTTEQNSPESTSPPSTSISATDDIAEKTTQVSRLEKELVKGLVEGQTEEN